MPHVRAMAYLTTYQVENKGYIYDTFKNMANVRLLEWGDKLVAVDPNTTNSKFRTYFNLSSRREFLLSQIATLNAELAANTTPMV